MSEEQKTEESALPERTVVLEEAIEAILFAAGHPITYAVLGRIFEMTPAKIKDKVTKYAESYNKQKLARGVVLLTYPESCQLCTKPQYLPEIRDALGIKKNGTLSTSSMEALAIVAYNQPVTRAFVDALRRADSSYAMNNLLDRGLIESKGRLDAPGRPMLYGTTTDFLRCFGLSGLEELPATSEEIMNMFDKAKAEEAAKSEEEGDGEQTEMTLEDAMNEGGEAAKAPQDGAAEEGESAPEEAPAAEEEEDTTSAEDDVRDDL